MAPVRAAPLPPRARPVADPAEPDRNPAHGADLELVTRAHAAALQVARLLSGVRQSQRLTQAEAAARFGTTPEVVRALEAGRTVELPHWPQTRRIVDAWLASAHVDPRPALQTLEAALAAMGEVAARQAARQQPEDRNAPRKSRQLDPRRALRRVAGVTREAKSRLGAGFGALRSTRARLQPGGISRLGRVGALAIVAVVIWTGLSESRVVAAAVSSLPPPAERAVRSMWDFFAVQFAPVRNGHRWIEVHDPRSRRGDKLQTTRHSD